MINDSNMNRLVVYRCFSLELCLLYTITQPACGRLCLTQTAGGELMVAKLLLPTPTTGAWLAMAFSQVWSWVSKATTKLQFLQVLLLLKGAEE